MGGADGQVGGCKKICGEKDRDGDGEGAELASAGAESGSPFPGPDEDPGQENEGAAGVDLEPPGAELEEVEDNHGGGANIAVGFFLTPADERAKDEKGAEGFYDDGAGSSEAEKGSEGINRVGVEEGLKGKEMDELRDLAEGASRAVVALPASAEVIGICALAETERAVHTTSDHSSMEILRTAVATVCEGFYLKRRGSV